MSVNINIKPPTNESRWLSVASGDFLLIKGTSEHPIPDGLYRVFIVKAESQSIFLTPLFDGDFPDNMFPYIFEQGIPDLPVITEKIHSVTIEIQLDR